MTALVVPAPRRLDGLRRFAYSFFRMPTGLAGLAILVVFTGLALFAPLFISADDLDVTKATGSSLASPSSHYPLGTDQPGRSVLLLVIWGTRASLAIGVTATALTMILGSAIGLLAGHYQRFLGRALMHVTDWFIALPSLPLAISLSAVIGQGATSITVAIAVTSWTSTAHAPSGPATCRSWCATCCPMSHRSSWCRAPSPSRVRSCRKRR
jgi:peptide/nickel transport system permease protein